MLVLVALQVSADKTAPGCIEGQTASPPRPANSPSRLTYGPGPWFEGARVEDFPEVIELAPGDIGEVCDPVGGEETVIALTAHNEDAARHCPPAPAYCNRNPRAQLGTGYFPDEGSEFWIQTKFLVPDDFPAGTEWQDLLSVYGPPYAGSAPWHLEIKDDALSWERTKEHSYDVPFQRPLERGGWTTVLVHERLARSDEGWVEMWIDGEPIAFFGPSSPHNPDHEPETTKLTMSTIDHTNDGGPNNVRIENYRQRGTPGAGTIYFGPLLVGPTRAGVEF